MGKKLREEGKWEEWSNDREEWEEGGRTVKGKWMRRSEEEEGRMREEGG